MIPSNKRFTPEQVAGLAQAASLQDLTEAAWPAFEAGVKVLTGKPVDYYSRNGSDIRRPDVTAIRKLWHTNGNGASKPSFMLEIALGQDSGYFMSDFYQEGKPVKFALLKDGEQQVGLCLQLANGSSEVFVLRN